MREKDLDLHMRGGDLRIMTLILAEIYGEVGQVFKEKLQSFSYEQRCLTLNLADLLVSLHDLLYSVLYTNSF